MSGSENAYGFRLTFCSDSKHLHDDGENPSTEEGRETCQTQVCPLGWKTWLVLVSNSPCRQITTCS